MNLKILLIGIGAIGGSLSCFIQDKGYDLTVVVHREETKEKIEKEGLHISGVLGEKRVFVPAVTQISDLKERYDIVFIATKAYQLEKVATEILPYLKENSKVISLQNGICLDLLAKIVGYHRSVGCLIGYGATMLERGHLEITSTGEFVIGSHPSVSMDLEDVKEILSSLFPTRISNNIYSELYSKLIVNSCITSLGALTGLKLGQMMKKRKIRSVFLNIMDEATKVAEAGNIHVVPYGGKLDYHKLMMHHGFFSRLKQHIVIMVVGKKYKNLKSSSLQSLERNEPTEIDFFNGYISSKGKELKVLTPVNDKIVKFIKQIEKKERPISIDNIKEF